MGCLCVCLFFVVIRRFFVMFLWFSFDVCVVVVVRWSVVWCCLVFFWCFYKVE